MFYESSDRNSKGESNYNENSDNINKKKIDKEEKGNFVEDKKLMQGKIKC